MKLNSVCVYCGSSNSVSEPYFEAARAMGAALGQRSLRLVYGGGSTGLMGALANAALENGSQVIGVIPEALMLPELAHSGLTDLEVVPGMHERKARMIELSDALITLPGGFGTLEEFFEALTWAQLGFHRKPVGMLNTNNYFDKMLEFLNYVEDQGFAYQRHVDLLQCDQDIEKLFAFMEAYEPPQEGKWS